jgi:hypothetical protein
MYLVQIDLGQTKAFQAIVQCAYQVNAPQSPWIGHKFRGNHDVMLSLLQEPTQKTFRSAIAVGFCGVEKAHIAGDARVKS